jgi:hypothetical protein
VGNVTLAMNATIHVGLALTSHDNTKLNTSTFDNVSISQVAPKGGVPFATITATAAKLNIASTNAAANSTYIRQLADLSSPTGSDKFSHLGL